MAASANDKLSETANGGIPAVAHVTATRATGVTSLSVDTQQYWPTSTGIKFSTYKVDTNGKQIAGSQTDWRGTSDGTGTLSNIARTGGAADAGNAIGDVVQMGPTAQWAEDLMEGLLAEHKQDGTHTNLNTDTLTATGNVTIGGSLTVSGGGLIPAGSILPFGGASSPSGFMLCDGSAISRATYAALFTAIGTAYGAGDGTTTFNLPDFRGRVPVGKNSGTFATLGSTGGEETHILTLSEMPAHGHGVTDPGHAHVVPNNVFAGSSTNTTAQVSGYQQITWGNQNTNSAGTGISIQNSGGGTAHNNLQPYQTINYIIKT
jgi:microcystin-dependent protein